MGELKKILILSHPKDPHALMVRAGLLAKGADVTLLCTSDFPTVATQTVLIGADRMLVHLHGPELDLLNNHFDVVWNRRPTIKMPEGVLHPSDFGWAERCCLLHQWGVFEILGKDALWVNKRGSDRSKLTQQVVAQQVGFHTPQTIYSNDPGAVRSFIESCEQGAIYKPLLPAAWKSLETGKTFSTGTKVVGIEDLADDEITRCSPGIYQELLPKAFELRVTVFGRHIAAIKVLSQETEKGKIDYRNAFDELEFVPYQVDPGTEAKIHAFMAAMDLRYGAMDFIVRPDGELIFLEVNESGQFLFLEDVCEIPVLDAFCDFLMSADPSFIYRPTSASIRLAEISPAVIAGYREFESVHIAPGDRSLILE